MWAIIGILLIVIGVIAILYLPSQGAAKANEATGSEEAKSTQDSGAGKNEEEEKKAKEEAAKNRDQQLSKLVAPGNLPPVHIYFGSQTGTAEKFCTVLDEEAGMLGISESKVIDFSNFSEDEFAKQKLVVVCVATHYEGDPCDNTRNFHKYLKKLARNKTDKPFEGMTFAIFGLGDTSYEQYNEMGVQFDKTFE